MSTLELRQLPNLEKIKIIEILWGDLTAQENDIPVPSWHESELCKTEADYQSGRISSLPWDDAKKALRARFE
ncbi:MAG: addiction module protein [Opitutaceae bacterium]|jgi:putative addiction module component (TIGR02574 family)|nr:addiction module protein [Opitutaceae bacterium]